MILEIDDWKFDIDMTATMDYSAAEASEHCTCAYCRNFYAAVDITYPQLRSFLAQFGIDIEAPDEMSPAASPVHQIHYDPMYYVFGRIIRFGTKEMTSGPVTIYAANGTGEYPERPLFELHASGITLPWMLKEPYITGNPIS